MSVSDTGHRGTQPLSPAFVLVILLVSCLLVVAALIPHEWREGLRAAELPAEPGVQDTAGTIAGAGGAARDHAENRTVIAVPPGEETAASGATPVEPATARPVAAVPAGGRRVRTTTAPAPLERLTGFDGMAALRSPVVVRAIAGVQRESASAHRKNHPRATQPTAEVVTADVRTPARQAGQVQQVSHTAPETVQPAVVTESRAEPPVENRPTGAVPRRRVAVAPVKAAETEPALKVPAEVTRATAAVVPDMAVPNATVEQSAAVPGETTRLPDAPEEPVRDISPPASESDPTTPQPGTVRINYAGFRTAVVPPAPAAPPVTKVVEPVVAVKPAPTPVRVQENNAPTEPAPEPEAVTEAEAGTEAVAVVAEAPQPATEAPVPEAEATPPAEEEEEPNEDNAEEEDVRTVAAVGPVLAPGAAIPPAPAAAVPGRQVPAAAAPGRLPGAVVPVAPAPAPLPLPLHDSPAASGPAPLPGNDTVLGNDTVEPLLPEGAAIPGPGPAGGVPTSEVTGVEVFAADPHAPILPADVAARAMKALEVQGQQPCCEVPGPGTIRAPFAVFDLDPARPQNALRLRFDSAAGINRPDRNEYFWGKIGGKGPGLAERNVDYGEFSVYSESMIGNSSGFIEMPLRFIDPEVNDGSSGPGLLTLGTKSLIFEGDGAFGFETPGTPNDSFQLSTVFRTSLSFSPRWAARGLNSGHMSLEPGLLATYQRSLRTVFHGELKYWIPLGADSDFANGVLRYGVGVSRVLKQSPPDDPHCRKYALIPTLELVGMNFSGGLQTMPDGSVVAADTGAIVNVVPGLRVVLGDHVEVGGSSSFVLTNTRYYESLHRLELRWFW